MNYLNDKHKNIKFTIEKEKDKTISFLDVMIDNSGTGISTSVIEKVLLLVF